MLDEEGREIEQPVDSFYRRAKETLLTFPVSVGTSGRACCFPAVRLRCHDLSRSIFWEGQKRRGKHIVASGRSFWDRKMTAAITILHIALGMGSQMLGVRQETSFMTAFLSYLRPPLAKMKTCAFRGDPHISCSFFPV